MGGQKFGGVSDLVDGVGQVDELGVVAVELGLLDLNDHLVVLIASLGASVLLVDVLRAATVIENSDLSTHKFSIEIAVSLVFA